MTNCFYMGATQLHYRKLHDSKFPTANVAFEGVSLEYISFMNNKRNAALFADSAILRPVSGAGSKEVFAFHAYLAYCIHPETGMRIGATIGKTISEVIQKLNVRIDEINSIKYAKHCQIKKKIRA